MTSLAVEDVKDENVRANSLRGSFKDALSGGRTGKFAIDYYPLRKQVK